MALAKMRAKPGDPYFKDIWRKFQLRVHPDLFTSYPELQAANSASLQKLQGILNDARTKERTTDEAVKPRTESLQFYLRTEKKEGAEPTFLRVPLTIRVPGPRCQNVLAESFSELFRHAGLPLVFHWGPEYWGSTCVFFCHSYFEGASFPPPTFSNKKQPHNNNNNNTRRYTLSKRVSDEEGED